VHKITRKNHHAGFLRLFVSVFIEVFTPTIPFVHKAIFDAKIMLSRPGNCSGSSFPVRFYTPLQRLAKIPPWQIQQQLAINLSRRLHSFG
jgi:hypothetical protein